MSSTFSRLLTTAALFALLAAGAFKAGSMYMSSPDPVTVAIPKGTTLTVQAYNIGDTMLAHVVEPSGSALMTDSAISRQLEKGTCIAAVKIAIAEGKVNSIGDVVLSCDKTDDVHIKAVLATTDSLTVGGQYRLLVQADSEVDVLPAKAP